MYQPKQRLLKILWRLGHRPKSIRPQTDADKTTTYPELVDRLQDLLVIKQLSTLKAKIHLRSLLSEIVTVLPYRA